MPVMNSATVAHIAELANIPVSKAEEETLAAGFTTTLKVVDQLMDVDTAGFAPTHQVTGLENVWREDIVDATQTFTQKEALANAKATHAGYFVVDQLISQ